MHSCMNCLHYDEGLSAKCKEPESPWVHDRSTQNACPFFEFRSANSLAPASGGQTDRTSEAEAAKKAFRALFRT